MNGKKLLVKLITLFALVALFMSMHSFAASEASKTLFCGFDDNSSLTATGYGNITTHSIEDGILHSQTTSNDPQFNLKFSVEVDNYSCVQIRMKQNLNARPDNGAFKTQIYYTGKDSAGKAISLSEGNSISLTIPQITDEYRIYTFNLNLSKLVGATLTGFRVDPVNSSGEFDIDYISIVPKEENPDMMFDFNTDTQGWTTANLTSYVVGNGAFTGVNKASNGLIEYNKFKYFGEDYQKVYVRMKTANHPAAATSVIYTNLVDEGGNTVKSTFSQASDGYWNVSKSISPSDEYKTYVYDFSGKQSYKANYISDFVLSCVNVADASFDVDYVLFKNSHKNNLYNFDIDGDTEGWTVSDSAIKAYNGALSYTNTTGTYVNPRISMSGLSLDADTVSGIEVIMKHDMTASGKTSADMKLYFTGTSSSGKTLSLGESNSAKATVVGASSGDAFVYYYIDLDNVATWKGSTIKSLRLDPIKALGNFEVESIRFLTRNVVTGVLDESLVSMDYSFANSVKASAKGTITVDFGEQDATFAKYVRLYWASGKRTNHSAYADA